MAGALPRACRGRLDDPQGDLRINPSHQAHAQAAAEVCRDLGQITHFPENPGWDAARFAFATVGTRSSNLAQGRIACRSVRAYMDDSDERNIDKVGHRAWCMNPAMPDGSSAGSVLSRYCFAKGETIGFPAVAS